MTSWYCYSRCLQTEWMTFLSANGQHQSTEGKNESKTYTRTQITDHIQGYDTQTQITDHMRDSLHQLQGRQSSSHSRDL